MTFVDIPAWLLDVMGKAGIGLASFWLGYSAKRPKLELGGIGSGGFDVAGKDVMATSFTIHNRPSFFGLPFNRDAATIVEARVYDPDLKEYVGPGLMWLAAEGPEMVRERTIASGRQATVMVLAKERHAEDFFVFASDRRSAELPRQLKKFKEARKDLELRLIDVNRHRYNYRFTARNDDQSVGVMRKGLRLGTRWNLLRRALGPM
ncbi:hypothetical protein [Rhizobacter sp. Root1221]|uniref:hypothetical protein n=1 Tax=Rhizobacter sp. Root1221 TaxID=1736433 RepID=UPI0006FAB093|nr:hypothetical protein [Rhizobacter sp. Root1221]KQV99948.1 hypothetical protein ASC87_19805 [Rhizobacter sp. Root1221]